jgi:DNA-binding NarL/FixJ family response regulator
MTIRVLVAGLGNMGRSHALAYHKDPAFEIVGLVNRSKVDLPAELHGYPITADYAEALARLKPDLVCIATYSDSHADYAVAAMEAGAHVFVEKPLDEQIVFQQAATAAPLELVQDGRLEHGGQTARRTISSLILPIALVGFRPLGHTSTQFMMV